MRKREDLTGFGARLRRLREKRNITQKDMIAKVNEYFNHKRFATVQAYNRYEIYDAQPNIEMLKCFSHIFEVSADELIDNNLSPLQKEKTASLPETGKQQENLRSALRYKNAVFRIRDVLIEEHVLSLHADEVLKMAKEETYGITEHASLKAADGNTDDLVSEERQNIILDEVRGTLERTHSYRFE